ncbi:MAG: cellulose binding domain-containing protein, partial [Terracidiphilus sp.]
MRLDSHHRPLPCGRALTRRLSGYFTVLAALLLAIFAPCAHAAAACNVVYTISPQNSSAFGAAITIQNTGTTAWTSWSLTWTFANGQTVSQLWNGIE